ncbi:MAG: hypothetical protein ACRETH_14005, partial [Steroidobacteraceae bacterium]
MANTGKIALAAGANQAILSIGPAGATLSGAGTVTLGDNAGDEITGSGMLTNNETIVGSGLIGGGALTLNNGAVGHIVGAGATGLTIDTGSNTIANAGLIEAGSKNAVIVKSVIANTGTLEVVRGTLTLDGTVTGSGSAKINGGTLDAEAAFSESVTFIGGKGVLELAQSQTYAGSVSGFSLTGASSLDLRDIGFVSSTEATFSGTATSGVLTVTDGTHTAHITLVGDYRASTFTASSDGHGGTIVVDPTAPAITAHRFIAAAAGLGGAVGGTAIQTSQGPPVRELMLASPHT